MNTLATRLMPHFHIKPLAAALIVAGVLSACGGGSDNNPPVTSSSGSGGTNTTPGNSTGNTNAGSSGSTAPTVMVCDDPGFQCSGKNVVSQGEVALTDFGVQVYGRASSDATVNPAGLQLDSGGTTEVRLAKDASGAISRVAVLLSGLGLSWDTKNERPKIIETFDPTQGRTVLDENGALKSVALPPSSDLGFYDFGTKGTAGTQANYANNRYFPRSAPSRCGAGYQSSCVADDPTKETDGLHYQAGNVASGQPDTVTALRFHEDGDVHAGDANASGGVLPGGSGQGAPFPGSKGYRTFTGLSYQYANLGAWFTQDTVSIAEWTAGDGSGEHNTNRRGVVAFGALTNPAMIPATGSATYSGTIVGRYASAKDADPVEFRGTATVNVNFAAHQAVVTIQSDSGSVPVTFTATTAFGTAGGNLANAMDGTANSGNLSGTIRARFFGPVASTGSSGQGPAEAGGAFSLKNASGAAVVGGFIARKQ